MTVKIRVMVLWDVTQSSLSEMKWHFREPSYHVCWKLREVAGITDFLYRAIVSTSWVYFSLNFVTKPTYLLSIFLQNAFNLKQWFITCSSISVNLQIIDLFAQTKQTHFSRWYMGRRCEMWVSVINALPTQIYMQQSLHYLVTAFTVFSSWDII
jgi:hypothetical protein